MPLIDPNDVAALDVGSDGLPYADVAASGSVDPGTLDVGWAGLPFYFAGSGGGVTPSPSDPILVMFIG